MILYCLIRDVKIQHSIVLSTLIFKIYWEEIAICSEFFQGLIGCNTEK
jgi:hypothetical protein